MALRVLVVDNYDSFVYTIVGYLAQLGAECEVRRNVVVTSEQIRACFCLTLSDRIVMGDRNNDSLPLINQPTDRTAGP